MYQVRLKGDTFSLQVSEMAKAEENWMHAVLERSVKDDMFFLVPGCGFCVQKLI